MAKKNTQQPQEQFKTMIGGQALIEGIMMLGPEKSAVVVRTKDGLQRKVEPRKLSQKWSPKKLPFIRGIFNFCTSMKTGVSALMYSADFFAEEDEDEKGKEPGRFEAWLEKRLSSEKAQNALITFSVVLGLAFSIALFFVLPSLLGSFLNRFVTTNEIVRNLLEGLLRIVIFLAYMFLVSRMKDMRRVFSYHGAEHKTIRCYEAKLPLTVENARKMTRLHPRCGTSFLFVVMIVSILVFSLATPLLRPITAGITSHWLEAIVRVVLKLGLLQTEDIRVQGCKGGHKVFFQAGPQAVDVPGNEFHRRSSLSVKTPAGRVFSPRRRGCLLILARGPEWRQPQAPGSCAPWSPWRPGPWRRPWRGPWGSGPAP